jgi:hypothetical protein
VKDRPLLPPTKDQEVAVKRKKSTYSFLSHYSAVIRREEESVELIKGKSFFSYLSEPEIYSIFILSRFLLI